MPRKKKVLPETHPERRRRLLRELLDLPTQELVIIHAVIEIAAERRQETIAEAGQPARAPFVEERDEETPGPRPRPVAARTPKKAAAAPPAGRRRRPRGYAAGTTTAPIQEEVAQVGDAAQPVGDLADLD